MKKRRLRALSGEEKRLIQEDARRHIPLCELAEAYGVTSRTILAVLAGVLPPIELPPERFAAGEPLNKLSERLGRNEQALLSQLNKLLQKRGLEENT